MFRHAVRRLQCSVLPGSRSYVMNTSVSTTGSRERCINKVQLMGRVGVDPKVFGKEGQLVSFPMGTTLRYKVNNEDGSVTENYRTTWHLLNIRIPWLREYALNYIRKGSRLLINGRLEYTQSTKEDGTVKDHTIIVVDDVITLSTPRPTETETPTEPQDNSTSDNQ